jgi:hypothetical protein
MREPISSRSNILKARNKFKNSPSHLGGALAEINKKDKTSINQLASKSLLIKVSIAKGQEE